MIKLIKLVDGTEVIGTISVPSSEEVLISDPLQVNFYTRTPSSVPVIALYRYMPLSKQREFSFDNEHIISIADPMAGLVEYYKVMLKDFIVQFDDNLNAELLEKAGVMATTYAEDMDKDMAEAVLEKMIKKPVLN